MSNSNLLQSLQRVTSTINRQIRHEPDDLDKVFESTRNPIDTFAANIEPAAREEFIRILSKAALYETPKGDAASEAASLGTLGQNVLNGNTDAATAVLEQGREYQTARVTRALKLAVSVNKTNVVDKLIAFSMKNSLDIPQVRLDGMLDQLIYKVTRNRNNNKKPYSSINKPTLEIYESLLAFKKALNTIHTRDAGKFAQATTRTINDHIELLIKRDNVPFLVDHVNLVAKLDTSYYDSRLDEVGLAKIEHALEENQPKDQLNIVELLQTLRTVEEENYTPESVQTTEKRARENTQAINQLVIKRMNTNSKGALNIFAQTLNLPESQYDIRTDPQALALIDAKLPQIIANTKYDLAERSRIVRSFRALLKTYSRTLDEAKLKRNH